MPKNIINAINSLKKTIAKIYKINSDNKHLFIFTILLIALLFNPCSFCNSEDILKNSKTNMNKGTKVTHTNIFTFNPIFTLKTS